MSILDDEKVFTHKMEHPFESEVKSWIKEMLPYLSEQDYEIKFNVYGKQYGNIFIQHKEIPTITIKNKDVVLSGYPNNRLPEYIHFGEIIGGSFICSHSKLTSMYGFPKVVGRVFDCSYCPGLTSLESAPLLVDRDFVVIGNRFNESDIRKHCQITGKVYC